LLFIVHHTVAYRNEIQRDSFMSVESFSKRKENLWIRTYKCPLMSLTTIF